MLRGKIKFYALRLLRYRDVRVRVKTPTAIVGVRGTKFGIHVYSSLSRGTGDRMVIRRMSDPHASNNTSAYLAQAGPEDGGRTYTDCFSEDGHLEVDGKIVAPGEIFRGRTGEVSPTPPGYVTRFEAETEINNDSGGTTAGEAGESEDQEEGDGDSKEDEDSEDAGDSEENDGTAEEDTSSGEDDGGEGGTDDLAGLADGEADLAATGDLAEDMTDTTQQETGGDISQENDISQGKTGPERSGTAAMITDATSGRAYFQASPMQTPVYVPEDDNILSVGQRPMSLTKHRVHPHWIPISGWRYRKSQPQTWT